MTVEKQIIKKIEQGEGLTVEEIKIYQSAVQPQKHIYGKYGSLKLKYLENKGMDWTITDLPTYLHGIDKQAEEMSSVLYTKLSVSEQYKRTGDFLEDYRRMTALQKTIEEEVLSEIIYTEEVV